jgi:hypothetical protein
MKPDTFCWFHIEPRRQKFFWILDPPLVARNDIKFWTLDPSLVARNDNGPWALESSEKREISTRSIPVPATCSFLQTHWPTTTRRRCQRCSPVPKAMSGSTVGSCWDRPSAFAGINRRLLPSALAEIDRRLLLGSTIGLITCNQEHDQAN